MRQRLNRSAWRNAVRLDTANSERGADEILHQDQEIVLQGGTRAAL